MWRDAASGHRASEAALLHLAFSRRHVDHRCRQRRAGDALKRSGDDGMRRPLEGLLVVALEQAVAAPLCSCRLADAGARVIKIERPEGDFARGYDRVAHGESSYFVWLNRGKESIVLDIKDADDHALLERMIARAD